MLETGRVWSLGREDPLEEGMTTHSSILAWRIAMDRGAWQAIVHGVAKSWTWLSDFTIWMYLEILFKMGEYISSLVLSFGASATQKKSPVNQSLSKWLCYNSLQIVCFSPTSLNTHQWTPFCANVPCNDFRVFKSMEVSLFKYSNS